MRIFISYAHVDWQFVDKLANRLRRYHDVWFDEHLHAGQEWWQTILAQLNWCECFVYALSPESLASKYCRDEYAEARNLSKQIVPIRLQPNIELPDALQRIQYADFSTRRFEDALADLIGDLGRIELQAKAQEAPPPVQKQQAISPTSQEQLDNFEAFREAVEARQANDYETALRLFNTLAQAAPDFLPEQVAGLIQHSQTELERQARRKEYDRLYKQVGLLTLDPFTLEDARQMWEDLQKEFPEIDDDPEELTLVFFHEVDAQPEELHHQAETERTSSEAGEGHIQSATAEESDTPRESEVASVQDVASGPMPATQPTIRAINPLWIVGGVIGVGLLAGILALSGVIGSGASPPEEEPTSEASAVEEEPATEISEPATEVFEPATEVSEPATEVPDVEEVSPTATRLPDGNNVLAYVCDQDICLENLDTGQTQTFDTGLAEEDLPVWLSWSPDATRLVYGNFRSGPEIVTNVSDLYTLYVRSGEIVQLTTTAEDELFPTWSPDGTKIAYVFGWAERHLYVMNADGTGRQLLSERYTQDIEWFPDSTRIAFGNGGRLEELYVIQQDGSGEEVLINQNVDRPAISPNGHWIAAQTEDDGMLGVLLFDTSTGDSRHLIPPSRGVYYTSFYWSPDSQYIAVQFYDGDEDYEVYTVSVDDGTLSNVSNAPTASDVLRGWSPDGERVVFSSDREGSQYSYTARPDGSDIQFLSEAARVYWAWASLPWPS